MWATHFAEGFTSPVDCRFHNSDARMLWNIMQFNLIITWAAKLRRKTFCFRRPLEKGRLRDWKCSGSDLYENWMVNNKNPSQNALFYLIFGHDFPLASSSAFCSVFVAVFGDSSFILCVLLMSKLLGDINLCVVVGKMPMLLHEVDALALCITYIFVCMFYSIV